MHKSCKKKILRNLLKLAYKENISYNFLNLEDEIKTEEVKEAIKNISPYKAPGPDGIYGIIYKRLPQQYIDYITQLFNKILSG